MSITGMGGNTPLLALVCALIASLFSFFVLDPTIGFDDANITLNYAENIAAGHGYVYNIGGERVEGSTSPLWTAINAGAYLLPASPEITLAALGFFIAWAIIWISMLYGEHAFRLAGAPAKIAPLLVAFGFLTLPAFFGWVVWSLMDFGFWVLLCSSAFWVLASSLATGEDIRRRPPILLFALIAAFMAATRPEGIAVVLGFSALMVLFSLVFQTDGARLRAMALAGALFGVLSYGGVALVRLVYFGDIFPNTYYSKVSTDHISQIIQGLRYGLQFLESPLNAGMIFLALLSGFVIRTGRAFRAFWAFTILAALGGMMLYVLIGGDHFGSFRFFLFVYPVFFPLAALALYRIYTYLPAALRKPAVPLMITLAVLIATSVRFATEKGGYEHEFRIAEQGRAIGNILNTYPGDPSIGVVPAGGVAMTFDGHIYDLLGLNWIEMARADRHQVGEYVNHGGFSRTVFYATLPDIVHPQIGECDKASYDGNRFFGKALRNVFQDTQFQELYEFECFEGLRFYKLKVRADG